MRRLPPLLLEDLAPGATLIADRAYDTNAIRELAAERGAWANIPPRTIRKGSFAFSSWVYRQRNLVERFFNQYQTVPRPGHTLRPKTRKLPRRSSTCCYPHLACSNISPHPRQIQTQRRAPMTRFSLPAITVPLATAVLADRGGRAPGRRGGAVFGRDGSGSVLERSPIRVSGRRRADRLELPPPKSIRADSSTASWSALAGRGLRFTSVLNADAPDGNATESSGEVGRPRRGLASSFSSERPAGAWLTFPTTRGSSPSPPGSSSAWGSAGSSTASCCTKCSSGITWSRAPAIRPTAWRTWRSTPSSTGSSMPRPTLFVVLGLVLLWRTAHRAHLWWSWKLLAGTMLMGFGIFNVVEGVIDHHLLGLHHVNETVPRDQWIYWDVGFLVWGGAMIAGGLALYRSGQRTPAASERRPGAPSRSATERGRGVSAWLPPSRAPSAAGRWWPPGQQAGELVGHRLLLAADLGADPRGLAVARQLGGGDQRPVGGDLEMLEGVARHRTLDDLVGRPCCRRRPASSR